MRKIVEAGSGMRPLCHDLRNDFPMYVRQSHMPTVEEVGQPLVVNPEYVQ